MEESRLTRLNKFIASSGFAARRKVDILILEGRVSVNSKTISELGVKINAEKDIVKVDGEVIKQQGKSKSDYIYILLNKPAGYVTTTSDEKNRPTVMDLIYNERGRGIKIKKRIYPVGRLDYDTEGLLLLMNDGELANKLMHPRHEIKKTYIAKINRPLDIKAEKRIKDGVIIDGKKTSKVDLEIIPHKERKHVQVTIHEGRNREVRKMFEAVGVYVRKLKRIEYANLNITGLKTGEWRYLNTDEVRGLKGVFK